MPHSYDNIPGVQSIEKLLKKRRGNSAPSSDDLYQLYEIIGITNTINCLFVVLSNYNEICSHIETICKDKKWRDIKEYFTRAKRTSVAILTERRYLRIIPNIEPPLDKDPKNYFHGDLSTSPLYANLGTFPANRANTSQHQRLQAQVLIGISLVQQYQRELEFSQLAVQTLAALREMASGNEGYPPLPDGTLSPDDDLSLLSSQDLEEPLSTISLFIARSFQLAHKNKA